MTKFQKWLLICLFLAGIVWPFIPFCVVAEMFFLLIPFGMIVGLTAIYLIVSLFSKSIDTKKVFYIFILLPVFLLAQAFSVFAVDTVQRLRAKSAIEELEVIKAETGSYPKLYEFVMGIEYSRLTNDRYVIEYSRGFFVTEKYYSQNKHWGSYSWND